jgi:SNW domain-containing protein 1
MSFRTYGLEARFSCAQLFSGRSLPPPRQVVARMAKKAVAASAAAELKAAAVTAAPAYLHRAGWVPRTLEDFGDGGAFPEILVAQYPLDMGRKGKTSNSMALVLDSEGKIEFDAVVKQGGTNKFSKAKDLIPIGEREKVDFTRPDEEAEAKTEAKTKEAMNKLLAGRQLASVASSQDAKTRQEGEFIRYTPTSADGEGKTRIVKMVERQQDPLEPAKHKHKRVPRGPGDPPPTVMHSPPRKVTKEDQEAWKIPPAISNWKNPNGYTIPLDKRLAADGRGLQDNTINNRFAHFAEALYLAGENAREEVMRRAEIRKEELMAEREAKEQSLQDLARQTIRAKEQIVREYVEQEAEQDHGDEGLSRAERDRVREERRYDRERKRRLEAAGGKRVRSDDDRDVSERIALGERVPMTKESMFDQRLFNQSEGLSTGFGADDEYNIYEKPLFTAGSQSALFKAPAANAADAEGYVSQAEMDKLMDTSRFKPDREFSGTDRSSAAARGPRSEPVQFDRGAAIGAPTQPKESAAPPAPAAPEGDLLAGLDDFLASAKRRATSPPGKKKKT